MRIDLYTHPRSAPSILERARTIRRRTIRIFGRTSPRAVGKPLLLAYIGPGTNGRLRRISTVRVDRRGRFRYDGWRPRRLGTYELWAFLGRIPDLAPAHRCPRTFELVR